MTCKNPEYQKFCAQVYKNVPCCEEIDKGYLSYFFSPSNSPNETGLVVQIFELGKVFAEKNIVKFRSEGTCMYPCIRPGDILHLEPKNAEQINIGDIAVYRRYSRLFAHRTINKENDNGSNYIITRSDTANQGNDGPSFDEDILGVVSYVERKGNVLRPEEKDYTLIMRFFLNICLRFYLLKQNLFRKIIYIISYIQQLKTYRKVARLLFSRTDKKMDFSIHVPLNTKINARFYRIISPEELLTLNLNSGENIISKLAISLNINSKTAAFLSFIFKPQDCPFSGCWVSEAKTRIRYRGTGIEEKLFEKADELLRQLGIPQIYVSIFKDAYLDRRFFRNMGFKEISTYKENLLRERDNSSIVYVVMERKVKGG